MTGRLSKTIEGSPVEVVCEGRTIRALLGLLPARRLLGTTTRAPSL